MDMDIKRLAKLAKLKFTPEEEEKYAAQMANIVAMVEKLPDLDASGPLIDPDNPMEMRKDEVVSRYTRWWQMPPKCRPAVSSSRKLFRNKLSFIENDFKLKGI